MLESVLVAISLRASHLSHTFVLWQALNQSHSLVHCISIAPLIGEAHTHLSHSHAKPQVTETISTSPQNKARVSLWLH